MIPDDPKRQLSPLRLRMVSVLLEDGRSVDEIAAELGMTVGTVERAVTALERARELELELEEKRGQAAAERWRANRAAARRAEAQRWTL